MTAKDNPIRTAMIKRLEEMSNDKTCTPANIADTILCIPEIAAMIIREDITLETLKKQDHSLADDSSIQERISKLFFKLDGIDQERYRANLNGDSKRVDELTAEAKALQSELDFLLMAEKRMKQNGQTRICLKTPADILRDTLIARLHTFSHLAPNVKVMDLSTGEAKGIAESIADVILADPFIRDALDKHTAQLPVHAHEVYPHHDWKRRDDGEVDMYAIGDDVHIGPLCKRCFHSPAHDDPNWDGGECIVDEDRCPGCAKPVIRPAKFCSECGQALIWPCL